LIVSDIVAVRQELVDRRVEVSDVFHSAAPGAASTSDLTSALKRAEAANGEHEKRTGQHDAEWAVWYASYIVAEQSGSELPQ
jgi:hypothetical protein